MVSASALGAENRGSSPATSHKKSTGGLASSVILASGKSTDGGLDGGQGGGPGRKRPRFKSTQEQSWGVS